MTTPARQSANRLNAQKSTGPRTPAGKARSARNAVKHGLLSPEPAVDRLSDEHSDDFDDLLAALIDEHRPQDAVEHTLLQRIASCIWRLRRAQRYELGALGLARRQLRRQDVEDDIKLQEHSDKVALSRLDLQDLDAHIKELKELPDLSDPAAARDAAPRLRELAVPRDAIFMDLPPPKLREALILRMECRRYDLEKYVTEQSKVLEEKRYSARLRRAQRDLNAAIPAPAELNNLVRYESMLDRQFYRALTHLERRRELRDRQEEQSDKRSNRDSSEPPGRKSAKSQGPQQPTPRAQGPVAPRAHESSNPRAQGTLAPHAQKTRTHRATKKKDETNPTDRPGAAGNADRAPKTNPNEPNPQPRAQDNCVPPQYNEPAPNRPMSPTRNANHPRAP